MLAVIFELEPVASSKQQYLDIAADLGRELQAIDGFISIERFQSLSQPGKLLSLSFWRDEAAISAWRNLAEHRSAQKAGREHLFSDYRLRVAEVLRDYGMNDRAMAPHDSQAVHD